MKKYGNYFYIFLIYIFVALSATQRTTGIFIFRKIQLNTIEVPLLNHLPFFHVLGGNLDFSEYKGPQKAACTLSPELYQLFWGYISS